MGRVLQWQGLELNQTKLQSVILRTYNLSQNQINDVHRNNNATHQTEQIATPREFMLGESNGGQHSNHPLSQQLSSTSRTPWLFNQRQLATNLSYNESYVDNFNYDGASPILSDYWMLLLIVLYVIIILGGIFGNASLIVTLYTQSSARLRNPLLVALCMADLMVTGISAPISVITLILTTKGSFSLSTLICGLISFMQVSQTTYI